MFLFQKCLLKSAVVLAVMILACSAILMCSIPASADVYTISLGNGAFPIARDAVHATTLTATVTRNGMPSFGDTVTFSIVSGPGTVVTPTVVTNMGCAIGSVKSSDIAGQDATIVVGASVAGVGTSGNVTVRGLTMTLTSTYQKIYIASQYHTSTPLTCTVHDSAGGPAWGNVIFRANYGLFSPVPGTSEKVVALDSTGVAHATLITGDIGGIDDVSVEMSQGTLRQTTQVRIADHNTATLNIKPHIKMGEQTYASAQIFDQWDVPYPLATITFSWQVPVNQEDPDIIVSDSSGSTVTSYGPNPTDDGWGTIQITTPRISNPQCRLKFTKVVNWTAQILENEGLTIKTDWESNGIKFSAGIDQTLKFVISASKAK